MPATPSPGKGKPNERPTSRNATTTHLTLQQLKSDIEKAPGVVKNATDARNYLALRQWSQPAQKITCSHLATILLSTRCAALMPRFLANTTLITKIATNQSKSS